MTGSANNDKGEYLKEINELKLIVDTMEKHGDNLNDELVRLEQ